MNPARIQDTHRQSTREMEKEHEQSPCQWTSVRTTELHSDHGMCWNNMGISTVATYAIPKVAAIHEDRKKADLTPDVKAEGSGGLSLLTCCLASSSSQASLWRT